MTSRRLFQTLSVLFNASKKGSEASRHSLLWDTKKCRETVSALSEETELARVFHFRNDLYHFTWLQRLVMFWISYCLFIPSVNLLCIFYRCYFRGLCQKKEALIFIIQYLQENRSITNAFFKACIWNFHYIWGSMENNVLF